jgi:hypothetical protein
VDGVPKGALRHQAWGAASQSYGSVSLPPDAAVQQQPQPVVGEVAKAVPDPLHLLDEQVQCFGGPVGAAIGGVEGEDLDLPDSHYWGVLACTVTSIIRKPRPPTFCTSL